MNRDTAAPTGAVARQGLPAPDRWWTVGAALMALALLLLWLAGYGPGSSMCRAPLLSGAVPPVAVPKRTDALIAQAEASPAAAPATPAPPALPAPAPTSKEPADAAPPLLPEPSNVYFALGKASVPAETGVQLASIVAFLKDNPGARAALAGFHDTKGSLAKNQQLAVERAHAVGALLVAAGIAEERIEFRKPEETAGSGPDEQARRVEVIVER